MKNIIKLFLLLITIIHISNANETVLTDQEKEWIKNNPTIKVHCTDGTAPYTFVDNGICKGYSIDHINLVASKVGLNVDAITGYSWNQYIEQLKNKELDVMLNIMKIPEREKYFAFTSTHFTIMNTVFIRENSSFEQLSDLNGKTISIPKGYSEAEQLKKLYPKIKLLYVDNEPDAFKLVSLGKADATVHNISVGSEILRKYGLSNIYPAFEIQDEEFKVNLRLATNKHNSVLRDILEKGLDTLSYGEKTKLKDKWFLKQHNNKPLNLFSIEEKEWIKNNPVIKVASEMDWPPFDYVEDGKPMGYSIDHIKLLAKKVGLDLEFVNGYKWSELIDLFKNKQIDVMPVFYKNSDREKYTLFSKPYTKSTLSLYSTKGNPKVNSVEDLKSGIKVGIQNGDASIPYLKTNYPDIEIIEFHGTKNTIKALATRKVDAIIENPFMYHYYVNKYHVYNLRLVDFFEPKGDTLTPSMHIGTRKDLPILHSILQKTMNNVSADEKTILNSKWLGNITSLDTQISEDKIKRKVPLTHEEQEFISEHKEIVVQNEMDYPPYDFVQNGIPSGFSIDYIRLIAKKTGLNIKFKNNLTWAELIEHSKAKKIDVMHTLRLNEERKKFLNFTKPYVKDYYALAVPYNSKIKSFEDTIGKKVSVLKGDLVSDTIKKEYPESNLIEYNTTLELLLSVVSGEVDAAAMGVATASYIAKKEMLPSFKFIKIGFVNKYIYPWHIGVRKDWPLLHNIIEKGMDAITPQELDTLRNRWLGGTTSDTDTEKIILTSEEKSFIKSNPIIKVHNESNWPPYNYEKNGKPLGYSIGIMDLIAKKTGLNVEYVTGPTWNEFLEMMKNKSLDVMLNIVKTEVRQNYLLYTPPYADNPNIIISQKDTPYSNIESLFGKTVAIPKGFFTQEVIEKNYPEVNLLLVKNTLESMKAVTFGKADAALGELAVFNHLSAEHMMNNLIVSGEAKMGDPEYSLLNIATRKDLPILQSILSKGIESLTIDEKRELQQKWLGTTLEKKVQIKLSKKEQKWLNNNRVIKVSNELDYPPFDFAVDKQPMGYSIDLLNLLAQKSGLEVKYINGYTWAELVKMFKKRELDLLHTLSITPERLKFGIYSDRFSRSKTHFISRSSDETINNIKQLYGKTVAVGKGWRIEEFFTNNHPEIKLYRVNSLEEMLLAVSSGKADVTADNSSVVKYVMKTKRIDDLKMGGWFKEMDQGDPVSFHFMAQKESPELISILNKAMASLSINELEKLEKKWFGDSNKIESKIDLTTEEKNYLSTKNEITMCIDPKWMPLEAFDKEGNHIGITSDYYKLFETNLNKKFTVIKTETWTQSLEFAQQRKCDILSLAMETPKRKEYLNFTSPYLPIPLVIATKVKVPFMSGISALDGFKVGIPKGYAFSELIKNKYPDINIVDVNDIDDGLKQVSKGKLFAYIGTLSSVGYKIQNDYIGELKVTGKVDENWELGIGVRNDDQLLLNILEKVVKSVNEVQKQKILNSWLSIKLEQSFDYKTLIYIIVIFSIILSLILSRHYAVRKMNKKLEKISITDALTNIYNRRHFNEVFPKVINSAKRDNDLVSFLIMDVDHFKQYNDTYGHQMGDDVLVKVARAIKDSLHRADDMCFRLGGEEFGVIFKADSKEKALEFANSIRENIEKLQIEHSENNASPYITASMGLICKNAKDINSDDEVYKEADDLLYKAKETGRNRVCI